MLHNTSFTVFWLIQYIFQGHLEIGTSIEKYFISNFSSNIGSKSYAQRVRLSRPKDSKCNYCWPEWKVPKHYNSLCIQEMENDNFGKRIGFFQASRERKIEKGGGCLTINQCCHISRWTTFCMKRLTYIRFFDTLIWFLMWTCFPRNGQYPNKKGLTLVW